MTPLTPVLAHSALYCITTRKLPCLKRCVNSPSARQCQAVCYFLRIVDQEENVDNM